LYEREISNVFVDSRVKVLVTENAIESKEVNNCFRGKSLFSPFLLFNDKKILGALLLTG